MEPVAPGSERELRDGKRAAGGLTARSGSWRGVRAVVAERRHGLAGAFDGGEVEIDEGDARFLAGVGEDLAPGRDGEGMAEGAARRALAHAVVAGLGRGEDEAAGLDRAGAQERVPVGAAGGDGEGGGHRQDL